MREKKLDFNAIRNREVYNTSVVKERNSLLNVAGMYKNYVIATNAKKPRF